MEQMIYGYMDWPRIEAIVYGEEASPKDVMKPRITLDGILLQGFFPEAEKAEVIVEGKSYEMICEDEAGYFACMVPGRKIPMYQYVVTKDGEEKRFTDPYAFPGMITEEEEKAFCAGVYYRVYEKLGAHPMVIDGVDGTYFAVWAPNAMRVSVVGDFNDWDGRGHMMHRMPMSGIFELFIPGVMPGEIYKYEIKKKNKEIHLKADPYATCTEKAPDNASIVTDISAFSWNDEKWLKERAVYADRKQPISIYETKLTDWEEPEKLAEFVKEMHYTHVELLPVMEYMEEAGEGYSTFAYYAPTRRIGEPKDFQKLVDMLHQAGVGVILDWAPAHFPRCAAGLEAFDGTPLYEIADPKYAVHPFWGTLLYNFASPMVSDFLIGNALYWADVYHIDGLRMDDVDAMLYLDYGRNYGEWQPNLFGTNENLYAMEFLKHLNSIMKKKYPGVLMIAQEDGLWPELTDSVENDHLGFDYKWSGGWTKDFISYLSAKETKRQELHDQLTLSTLYAYSERYILTLGKRDIGNAEEFLKKLPGTEEEKLSLVKAACAYQMLHPGCKMTSFAAEMPKEVQKCIADLNVLYQNQPALYLCDDSYDGLEWIQLMKYEENVLTFMRKTEKTDETLLAVCNFSGKPLKKYRVGVPFAGKYKEIFNTDAKEYGGAANQNVRAKNASSVECDEREHSILMTVPAFGVSIWSCTESHAKEKTKK